MSDDADDMMAEAQRWSDESEVCPCCGTRYLPSGFGCPNCEDGECPNTCRAHLSPYARGGNT